MARKDISFTEDELAAFLEAGRNLQVATNGPDGFPHLSTLWYFIVDGKVGFRSFTKSQKIVNLQRDDRITVLVEKGDSYETLQGAMIRGRAALSTNRDRVLDFYRRITEKCGGPGIEPGSVDPDAIEAMFGRFADKNTAVIIEPEKIVTWDHTKLGGGY